MKKIIYNKKWNKLLVSLILCVMTFTYIFPCAVMAIEGESAAVGNPVKSENGCDYYEVKGSIQEVMNSVSHSRNYLNTNSSIQTVADKFEANGQHYDYETQQKKLENAIKASIKQWINTNFPDIVNYVKDNNLPDTSSIINDSNKIKELCIDKIYNDNRNDSSKIEAICSLINDTSLEMGWKITGYSATTNLNISDVKTTLAKSSSEIGEVGTDSGRDITTKDDGVDSADLGGILLSPVFYLINFVADAITSNLGRIMIGDDASFANVTGTKVLQADVITPDPNKNYTEIEANMEGNLIGTIQYPNIPYTPEEIFAGKIDLLSIDFISGKNYEGNQNENSGWRNIRTVISQWYSVLRMIAIIGLLSVLIYTGIKIIISANAKDKAKYKEWIINWLLAVAILFFMHYIMAFVISLTGEFSKLLNQAGEGILINNKGTKSATNLMGLVRYMIQSENFYVKIGYEAMYIALIVYTIKFTVIYLKRVLNMAFLTLIAPIVALTYPIDKINDGKAQGFDMWLKEYIFNALLQPMHLVMYYVLVGSAVSVAAKNPIYGIVVLAFMTEAEKLLKKIFGFDKAGGGTVGGMTSAFAAGAIASNIAKMAKLPKGNASKSGAGGADATNSYMDNLKPAKDKPETDNFTNLLDDGNAPPVEDTTVGEEPSKPPFREETDSEKSSNEEPSNVDTPSGDEPREEPHYEDTPSENESSENSPSEEPASKNTSNEDSSNGDFLKDISKKDNGEPVKEKSARMQAIGNGLKNVGKTAVRPIYDFSRDKKYNAQRWKRRGINALKGAGKLAVGATLGTAAAAVQAGISITDGKYNPMEGVASFTAGYAGGSGVASRVGRSVSNSFMEGYYQDNQKALMKKRKEQFMYDDKVDKEYQKKYQDKAKAQKMKQLASDQLVPYGITETKDQFKIQKFANHIVDSKQGLDDKQKEKLLEQAIDQGRRTQGFIDNLTSQGQQKAINDPDQQKKYIASIIKAEGVDANSERAKQITNSLNNAFKSAAVYQQVNRK